MSEPEYEDSAARQNDLDQAAEDARAERVTELRGWQPIETAPKDDCWFLAASAHMVHIACRANGEILDVGAQLETGKIGLYEPAYEFTHWMPLPEPPDV